MSLILIVEKSDEEPTIEILYSCENLDQVAHWLNTEYKGISDTLEWQFWEPGHMVHTRRGTIHRKTITTYEYHVMNVLNPLDWNAGEFSGT